MRERAHGVLAAAFAALLAGCASDGMQEGTAASGLEGSGHPTMAEVCPMQVPGTSVAAQEIEGGAALAFTTTGDVEQLRARVERMAQMHNRHQAAGVGGCACPHGGMGAHHGAAGAEHPMMPPASASAEQIDRGARLVLKPNDPAQLAALRGHVASHAAMMAQGGCPMMGAGTMGSGAHQGMGHGGHRGH